MSKKTIIFGVLILVWMILIFGMSNSTGEESGSMSRDITVFIINKYDKITNASKETIKYHQTDEFIDGANYIFRKICHFGEYFILGILFFNFIISFNRFRMLLCNIYSISFCLLNAILDEFHQTFVPGRGGVVTDVLIDTFGAIVGTMIICFIYVIYDKKHKKTS